jgi:MFS family permease
MFLGLGGSIATGLLYFTPDNGWICLSVMRFFVGLGVGGLYCVDLPLVQEFMPSSKRGWVGGIVTCVIPLVRSVTPPPRRTEAQGGAGRICAAADAG